MVGLAKRVPAALANPSLGVEIATVNDLTNPETLAHLLKYDSVHGVCRTRSATEGDLSLMVIRFQFFKRDQLISVGATTV